MPRPSKRKLQVASKKRNKNGSFSVVQEQRQAAVENNDDGRMQILENGEIWSAEDFQEFQNVEKRLELVWKEDALKNKRVYYDSTSRTTQWRKRKAEEELKEHVHSFAKIDTFFRPSTLISASSSAFTSSLPSSFFPDLQACLEDLNNRCKILKSNKSYDTYEYIQLLSLHQYYQLCLNGMGKMNASLQIAENFWRKGDYMSRCIRTWGKYFLLNGELPVNQQGKHTKIECLLDSEDFVNQCQKWLRQQKPESRLPKELKNYIEETVFPKMTGYIKKDTISEETCRKYMHIWGYKYDEKRKDVFYDGHERPDVVQYRKEWLNRMFNYKRLMKDYDSDMLDEIIEPQLQPGEKEHVIVTHDESHFYVNEGQRKLWIQNREDILRSKY